MKDLRAEQEICPEFRLFEVMRDIRMLQEDRDYDGEAETQADDSQIFEILRLGIAVTHKVVQSAKYFLNHILPGTVLRQAVPPYR